MKRKNTVERGKLLYVLITIVILTASAAGISLFKGNSTPASSDDVPQQNELEVSFIDVGQGDCSLIKCGDTSILIDCGEKSEAAAVRTYLKSEGISSLSMFVSTHPHADHIGAAADIINTFSPEKIVLTTFSEINIPTTSTYENFLDAAADCTGEIIPAKAGDSFEYGDMTLSVISPENETGDYNDMSIVIKMTYKGVSFLFAGDISSAIEKQIISNGYDIKADVLKTAHHGSNTSSSEDFILRVAPRYAVISCGKGNSYGHPNTETLDILRGCSAEILRTDENGTVVFTYNGKKLSVKE